MAAESIHDVLEDNDWSVMRRRMEKVSAADVAAMPLLVVCSSTYGEGEVPDNGKALFTELEQVRPNLSETRYAVFGLGDQKNYPATYNNGGKRWNDLLAELGAAPILERYRHDASSGEFADEAAEGWAEDLLDAL